MMSNKAKNLSKLLHFTESLCAFADDVADYEYHDCLFNVEIDDGKFQFDLPELVAEIRKYRQAVIDDIEKFNDEPSSNEPEPSVPDFTAKKTSSDEITMSDFDYFRQDMPDSVKPIFYLMLPLSIIEEAKAHERAPEPKPKSERVKAIEMYTMLRMVQIALI